MKILGFGELTHDAHYDRSTSELTNRGSRGGGSVWNIVANAIQYEAGVFEAALAIGVSGSDERRNIALEDNEQLGIQTLLMSESYGQVTSTMHHLMRVRPPLYGSKYQTTNRCLICHRRSKPD